MSAVPEAGSLGGSASRTWVRRGLLALLLVAYVILASAYRHATPFGEGPDEPGHIAYVSFLRAKGRPPRHGEVDAVLEQQVKHPPLYYALGALATLGHDDRGLSFAPNPQFSTNLAAPPTFTAHSHGQDEQVPWARRYAFVDALRRLSLWLGVVTVLATFALAATVLPGAWWLAFTSAAVVAFLPQFLFMSGVANNDALATALGSLALVAAARVAVRPPRRRDFALLGLLLGAGLMAKLTTLALVGVGLLAVAIAARRARSWRLLGQGALWVGAGLLLLGGGWFAWNVAQTGDLLGWSGFEQAASRSLRRTPLAPELPIYFQLLGESFVGRFGWMVVALPALAYSAVGWLALAAALGLGLQALAGWRRPDRADSAVAPSAWWGIGLLVAAVGLMAASVFRLAFTFDLVVAQGRYLFPALGAFAVLFVLGLTGWLAPRWRAPAQAALAAGCFALGLYAYAAVLGPAFQPVTGTWPALSSPGTVQADFGPGWVQLLGSDCPPLQRLSSEMSVEWPLVWQTTDRQPDEGLVLFTQVIDGSGAVLAQDDRLPLGGRYPSAAWLPGRRFTETLRLALPPVPSPRRATVVTGWYRDGMPEERVPVVGSAPSCSYGAGTANLDERTYAWPVVLAPSSPVTVPVTATVRGDEFGQPAVARLAGVEVEAGRGQDGQARADLRTWWQALSSDTVDRTVFIHLLDAEGRPVATADGPPAAGQYPTSLWQPGDMVPDTRSLSLSDIAAGSYRLAVGWYDVESGERQVAQDAAGRRWAQDAAVLGKVVVDEAGARFEAEP